MGFPGGTIDVMEKVEDGDITEERNDEDDEVIANAVGDSGALDPRAGHVDVELPLINFNARGVAKFLEKYRFKKFTNAKTRKILFDLMNKFEKLAEGEYPLGMKEVPEIPDMNINDLTEEAAENLMGYKARLINNEDSDEEEAAEEMKENDVHLNKVKMNGKKRKTELKQKLPHKKKVCLQEEGNSHEVANAKVSKKRAMQSKKKTRVTISEDSTSYSKENMDSISIITTEVEGEVRTNHIENKSTHMLEPLGSTLPSPTKAQVTPNPETLGSGTDVLLKHLAPHLLGSKKPKRRASLPATFQTDIVEDSNAGNPEKDDVKSGSIKKIKRRKSLWEEPLQDGEYEIFIPKEQIVARKKRLSDANSLNVSSPIGLKLKV